VQSASTSGQEGCFDGNSNIHYDVLRRQPVLCSPDSNACAALIFRVEANQRTGLQLASAVASTYPDLMSIPKHDDRQLYDAAVGVQGCSSSHRPVVLQPKQCSKRRHRGMLQ
jgi:hypothetical protein